MKLYKEVLIESAEQAEALPDGTIATYPNAWPIEMFQGRWQNDADTFDHRQMVGFTALVPIEAEETRDEGTGWIVPTAFGPKLMGAYLGRPDNTPAKRYTQTIWRTPWTPTEEA